MKSDVKGIIPPVVTPLTKDLKFDSKAFENIINHVIDGGVHGVFILGTNGEGACLNDEIRLQVIRSAVSIVANRVPLFVNVSSSSYMESSALGEYAANEGADYVVISPPYYFDLNQRELSSFFSQLASNSKLPVFLYNIPSYTKTAISVETVNRLARHENIVGLKDSSGDMDYMKRLLKERKDRTFKILVGTELLLKDSVLLGADGGINGGANVFPEVYVQMYDACIEKNGEQQDRLQGVMEDIGSRIYQVYDSPMGIIFGLKQALAIKGLCSAHMAMPIYQELASDERRLMTLFVDSNPSKAG